MSNIASDAGYVVLIPLGAVIFASFGRHPLAGIAAAFAGVSEGFSANLLIGTTDPLLGGLSTSAAQIVLPGYSVDATAYYFFMFASTFLITIIGAWLTDKVVEPRLGEYTGPKLEVDANSELTAQERKGLRVSLLSIIIFVVVILFMVLPENAIFKLTEKEIAEFVSELTAQERKGLRVSLLSIIIFVVVILFMVLPENAIFKLTEKEIAEFVKANHRQPGTMELLKPFFGQSIVFVLMFMVLPENAIFKLTEKEIAEFVKANHRQPGTMELLKPFFGQSIVFVLMLAFFIPGLCYGETTRNNGTFKTFLWTINSICFNVSIFYTWIMLWSYSRNC